jgi:mannose-6-phosphate isomerase-like protein (cupin superfamily)
MKLFETHELLAEQATAVKPYHEFLRESSMSLGLYVLPAGGTDPQQPHAEDEVYYVLNGRAQITVNGKQHPVQPGSLIFVPKQADHRFHSISEELQLLVFFAPAEGGNP